MTRALWSALRRARYALPGIAGRMLPAPDAAAVLKRGTRLHRRGIGTALGYFHDDAADAATVAEANLAALALAKSQPGDRYLSLKAPALGFDARRIRDIAEAAKAAGMAIVFDAHAPGQADATLDLAEALLAEHPATGCALPARWRRSPADAMRFRDLSAPLRLVKGEWADAEADPEDIASAYLDLTARLAGRAAPVAVASHDLALVERALGLLLAAGTPCTLEQLRGLPRRRTTAIARRLGGPVRLYLPFGPGWWPYALNQALARPHLIAAHLKDIAA